jgi:N-ethylmaleimide reductase
MVMKLLERYSLGDLSLNNRMVMAPMTRRRASDGGVVGDMTVSYYTQRATAGLLITEEINISEQAVGVLNTPGLYTVEQVEGWRNVTEAVHKEGGLIFAQLWHTGRTGHSVIKNGELVAPSPVRIPGSRNFNSSGALEYEIPRALTTNEVKKVVMDYRKASENAKLAGFDGVELHGANGYLPNQFLVESANLRTDEYGGSINNRVRFVLEVMKSMVEVWGNNRVGIKISPAFSNNGITDSDPVALYTYLVGNLNELPLAYLHLSTAMYTSPDFPESQKDVPGLYGSISRNPVILGGGYDRNSAEDEIVSGMADLISFGVHFLANPDLPYRFKMNAELNPPDRSAFYTAGSKGYIDYPFLNEVSSTVNE